MKEIISKVNETKSWFFEKITTDKPLDRLFKKKREMTQIKIRNEKEVTTDSTEIQRIIRGYYIFEKYKCPGIAFFLQSSRNVSNEQPCLKTTGLYDDLSLLSSLFHLFNFIFNAPISFNSCFPISPFFLLFWFHKIFMLLFIICFHVLFNIPHCI